MIQQKLDDAKRVITEHNAQVGEDAALHIDADAVVRKIKLSGGTSEDRLRGLSHEDILAVLPVIDGVKPIGLAKEIAKVFRGTGAPFNPADAPPAVSFVGPRSAERMTPLELLQAYSPTDPTSAVAKRLSALSKGLPFVILLDGNRVDAANSAVLLEEIQQGFGSRKFKTIGDKTYTPYAIGDALPVMADENPLYAGRPLRPDGTCDQLNRSWEGVPQNTRVLVYLAVSGGELKVTHESAHSTLDLALDADGFTKLHRRYPVAAAHYRERELSGNLPTLRIPLKTKSVERGSMLSSGTPAKFA